MAKYFNGYVGIDFCKQNLKSNLLKDKDKILAHANYLPLRNNIFDLSLTCTVLMHNPLVEEIITEIERVTKTNILFIESRRKLKSGYKHPYRDYVKDFLFISKRDLETRFSNKKSCLSLWLFNKNTLTQWCKQ